MTKTVYLDQSTFCDLAKCENGDVTVPACYQALIPVVKQLAHEGRLYASSAHLIETTKWRGSEADQYLIWLDALPLKWIRPVENLSTNEIAEAMLTAAGIPLPQGSFSPFRDEIHMAFSGFKVEELLWLFADPSRLKPSTFIESARNLKFDRWTADIEEWVHTFNTDISASWSKSQRQVERTKKAETQLYNRGLAMLRLLSCQSGLQFPSDIMDKFMVYVKDPKALPSVYAQDAAADAVERDMRARIPGSAAAARLASSCPWDFVHAATGGAYCDVFTCDKRMYPEISTLRHKMGKETFSVQDTPEQFVTALIAAF